MKVLIAGMDGYLGWPLAQWLAARGHEVAGADLMLRRQWVEEMGSQSAIPIADMPDRLDAFAAKWGHRPLYRHGDLRDYPFVEQLLRDVRPDAIVHLAECPSAPYSQMDVQHATFVQTNAIVTTMNLLFAMHEICPDAHLVKLGTMGEYGTPAIDIPEGFFEIEFRGRKDRLPFPRQAGSWYHWSKVHDSNNVMFACRLWGLRSTDIMQGVVYGTRIPEMAGDPRLTTRMDIDQCFGTAINRFCSQAVIGHPLTVYGAGRQRRGFLPLADSMQCLTLVIEQPPARGEYRVVNQFEDVHGIEELALAVQRVGGTMGMDVELQHFENPRSIEAPEHYYNPDREKLIALGYTPAHDLDGQIREMLEDLRPHRERIEVKRDILVPDIRWDGSRHRSAETR
ncbi:MAG: NAD-dependent epimerase/dehydratase family protein [Acidobacteriota bacterium]|nr:NAD-dependent epimerase/dehydratase family protein [Acidobacteriota bacterium]